MSLGIPFLFCRIQDKLEGPGFFSSRKKRFREICSTSSSSYSTIIGNNNRRCLSYPQRAHTCCPRWPAATENLTSSVRALIDCGHCTPSWILDLRIYLYVLRTRYCEHYLLLPVRPASPPHTTSRGTPLFPSLAAQVVCP